MSTPSSITGNAHAIAIPYNLTEKQLVLDPGAHGETLDSVMDWITAEVPMSEDNDEVERIFRAAVLLYAKGAGTFGECLSTATIWERG